MAKIEPAVLTCCYLLANGDNYIDLAKDLSVQNRRLMRQGYTYAVANVQVYFDGADSTATDTSQQTRSVQVQTIPNSWIVHNAWSKAYRAWRSQQMGYLRDMEATSAIPKYADFKIAMDATHVALDSGSGDQDMSIDVRQSDFNTTLVPDEWKLSRFHWDDDGTERSPICHMLGQVSSTNQVYVGLVENYGDSRVRVQASEPILPGDASVSIYAKILDQDELAAAIVQDIEDTNDAPPYDADAYIGGNSIGPTPQTVGFAAVNVTNPVANIGSFIAPCGLLKVSVDAWHDADPGTPGTDLTDMSVSSTRVIVTLVPGPYRGVMAAPMGQ